MELGEENGGIVLNIGQGGAGVQLAMPLQGDELPPLRLQLPQSTNRIKLCGRVVWVSESRKEAGIQFVQIPDEARRQIERWISAEHSRAELRRGVDTVAENAKPTPAVTPTQQPLNPIPQEVASRVQAQPRMTDSVLFPRAETASVNREAERWGWWAVAALTGALLVIAFAIGVAIGRGALEKWPTEIIRAKQAASEVAKGTEAPPAPTAPSPPQASAAQPSTENLSQVPADNVAKAPAENASQPPVENLPPPRLNRGMASAPPPRDEAPGGMLVGAAVVGNPTFPLRLPETAVSASGSVAITSRRSVPMPPGYEPRGSLADASLSIGELNRHVSPFYPPDAREQHVEGIVKLRAVIGRDGAVQIVEPVSGPPQLVRAAMSAVREWRYDPTRLDGSPVETQDDISLIFRLP
jgi:TonB family protein